MTTKSTAGALRKTGVSVIGDVRWGTHFCYFYETKQDLLDLLIPYFKTGLESNEFCLWIISNSELLTAQEARNALQEVLPDLDRYVAERSMEVVGHDAWFLNGGTFDFHRVANRFKEKVDEALARGYVGMRLNGSPAWLQTSNAKVLRKFEEEVDQLFSNEPIIASCTYPIGRSRADFLLDVARNHQFAIARRHGDWDIVETPELIQTKAEIKRLNDELEEKVEQRTRELATTNEALRMEIDQRKETEETLERYTHLLQTFSRRLFEVQEEERRHLARELHDEIGQALTAAKITLQSVTGNGGSATVRRVQETTAIIDHLLGQVRQISLDLRPSMLDDLGLVPALRSLIDQQGRRASVAMGFSAKNLPENFDAKIQTTCFRIAQESITNALRHGRATRVDVELRRDDENLRLVIRDNGTGFDAGLVQAQTVGLGLIGIKERAALVGGLAKIISSPNEGTTIEVSMPLTFRPEHLGRDIGK